ncbi:MAG: acetyl-coenzyme A synthetase N-terminal domain-containing protein, partial [Actinomycetota bacterium]|nr:acetyl-coenzyme A synthetase N-terminal domain-containing protein [Actinomycetota bacterium]
MGRYEEVYTRSFDDPEGFWRQAADAITWEERPPQVFDAAN